MNGQIRAAIVATAVGLVFGLTLHGIVAYTRDHGPTWGDYSLKGNGGIAPLLLAPLGVTLGMAYAARRRAWLGLTLLPIATFVGLFVILGGV